MDIRCPPNTLEIFSKSFMLSTIFLHGHGDKFYHLQENFTVLPKIYWTIHFFAAYDFYERIFHYKFFKNVRKYDSNLSQWKYIQLRFLISYLFHHYMIYS
jgi:hypothetical protein